MPTCAMSSPAMLLRSRRSKEANWSLIRSSKSWSIFRVPAALELRTFFVIPFSLEFRMNHKSGNTASISSTNTRKGDERGGYRGEASRAFAKGLQSMPPEIASPGRNLRNVVCAQFASARLPKSKVRNVYFTKDSRVRKFRLRDTGDEH